MMHSLRLMLVFGGMVLYWVLQLYRSAMISHFTVIVGEFMSCCARILILWSWRDFVYTHWHSVLLQLQPAAG